ncbi:hypothetical protein ABQZ99_012140 [Xanthomonas hortorum pv. vitians]|uniref:Lipoprotein n=1 Tax=Xanthomonas hortorum pv. vitians TaxID=83224 RepID=A0A6V7DVU5_9XANT|nr:hypothetical protein [Xanthomonas hortorum]APP84551.1 hypothetical protein BI317_10635 [Xanthomonas hortorum pv. gardneri]ASW45594.1 hypothetical protein XJ27_06075 [Xanthomonas hortorum]MCC8496087.1 hypothetical protein [Xanthomonas hortorum pv. gardneri]MCE4282589.1 hypothetical protein [Xanthomonas hortorum pv. vitians]MCE4286023.1 hypothetical protein [Xanthomonas hortorum pv. vitians]
MRLFFCTALAIVVSAFLPGCAFIQDVMRGPRPSANGFVTVSCTNNLPNPAQPCEEEALRACSDTAIRQFVTASSLPNMVTIYPSKQERKDNKRDGKSNRDDRPAEQPRTEQQGYKISAEYQCFLTKPQPWDSGYTPPAK